MLNLRPIISVIVRQYALPKFGIHGVAHWARVLENGVRLAKITGANVEVVRLFAILHDSQRVTEDVDPAHGIRAAKLAVALRGKLFDLRGDDLDLLFVACAGHMDNPTDDDPTIQTCWDADRLDLGSAGISIGSSWFGAATLDNPKLMAWADRRATTRTIPKLIQRQWGIETDRWPARIQHPSRHTGRRQPAIALVH